MKSTQLKKYLSMLLALATLLTMISFSLSVQASGTEEIPEGKLVIGYMYSTKENDSSVPVSHSFVEIYNPTDETIVLTDNYSLHFMPMNNTAKWDKCDLVGEIPAKHSFLVSFGETGSENPNIDLSTFDQVFTDHAPMHNKGVKFVITSNQNEIPGSIKNPFTGDGEGQIEGYVDMFGVSGNDNSTPAADGYETECVRAGDNNGQSKQKGFRRVSETGEVYADTDNNLMDFVVIDFRGNLTYPRSLADGAWDPEDTTEPTTAPPDPVVTAGELVIGYMYSSKSDTTVSVSHSFVEIYNTTDKAIVLTDNYSLHYMPMNNTTKWDKCDLVGEIPPYHSFLVVFNETDSASPTVDLATYDQVFTEHAEMHNKGVKLVITSNQNEIPATVKNPYTGDGEGQIEGYVDMFGVSGNDFSSPEADGYETACVPAGSGNGQSKQKGFMRISSSGERYRDTDNNLNDFECIDFRETFIYPRSLADGEYIAEDIIAPGEEKTTAQLGKFVNNIPNNISVTFTSSPATTRTITWQTSANIKTGKVIIDETEYPAVSELIESKYHHRVDLINLDPDTEYEYYCGGQGSYSPVYTFKTAKESITEFSMLHVTDTQLGSSGDIAADSEVWKNLINNAFLFNPNPDFVLNTGDIVENARESDISYYFDYAQESLASNAFVYSMGNNDSGSWYNKYFYTMDNGHNGHSYSFDYGDAHFVNVDSNDAVTSELLTWLENDLASTDKTWKVFITHAGDFGRTGTETEITKLLDEYGVQLALVGHNHFYCRTIPMGSRGNAKEGGTVWSMPNTAGTKYNLKAAWQSWFSVNEQPELPMFSNITFKADSIVLDAYTVDGDFIELYDTYTITKPDEDTTEPPTSISDVVGDVDLSGELTINDVTDLQRYLAKLSDLVPQALINAEFNQDGEVNINDATDMQKCLAKLPW